ncbi:YlmC/YmxH family sporulation protein [Metallumcola ferriviriculae]|uniref:YlmC/YmxH family sporulation protein n=1 Tax=Metallumcola ferriviriculae TaxID=3039180 RepID=A0AAU0UKX9_9FIRM|nr:YlmC/YmxH family sporulation protein [Desulfitibacteraceae bacterium MK1]
MVKISELRSRTVINVADGRSLGYIKDIELDLDAGRIKSLILPGENRFLSFLRRNEDIAIEWKHIFKVGVDVILVEMQNFVDPKHDREE